MSLATRAPLTKLPGFQVDPPQRRPKNVAVQPDRIPEFAALLRQERSRLFGDNKSAFCQAAGITRMTLRMLESGSQNPTDKTVAKLATVLQTTPEVLTGARRVEPDHPKLKDLTEKDLDVAQMFHHADLDVKQEVLGVLQTREPPQGSRDDLTADILAHAKDLDALAADDRYLFTRMIARFKRTAALPVDAASVDPEVLEWGTRVTALTLKQADAKKAILALEKAERQKIAKLKKRRPKR